MSSTPVLDPQLSFMKTTAIDRREQRQPRQRVPFFKKIGTFITPIFFFGLLIPVALYLVMMDRLGWPSPLVGLRGVVAYFSPTSTNVLLYTSPSTQAYFEKIGGKYEVLLTPWRGYFSNRKSDFTEINDITKLGKFNNGVLILPSAVAINDLERREITAFRLRGGSVLTTWATGTRNGGGEWQGWQFLETLGVNVLGEIPAESEDRQLILSGESPLSHTHPSGQRIWMSKTSESLLRFKADKVAGRFMNWARETDGERRGEGAIVYNEAAVTTTTSSRSASFAFAETAWESHPFATYGLIDDTLRWLLREPVIVRAAWPNGKLAAQVIEMDTEEGFTNAPSFAAMMRWALDYRATFYVLTSVGKQFPDLLSRLANDFDIAYHGDVHDSFKDQLPQLQEQRIQNMQQQMASVLPDTKRITGFRAPNEGYNQTTERLLQKFGIRHHAVDPQRTEGRLPEMAKIEGVDAGDTLVLLPRTQRDDINLMGQNLSAEKTTQALVDDFDLALDTGALGWLSVHSQSFKPDGILLKAMPPYLEHVKKQRSALWLASAGQVADWWRERERFKLSTTHTGQRIEFNITITGKAPVAGASLVVMLPQKGVVPIVRASKIGFKEPVVFKIDEFRSALVFDTLNPGNYAYQVTFSFSH